VSAALEHVVEANILLSGVGFESGGLASAHGIHNGLTALPETHAFYHGEKVAYGVLAGLALADADPEETASVYAFCESIGLPTTLSDLGLAGYDRARLMPAAEKACASGECTHNEQGEITPQKVLEALIAADAIGMQRRRERI
jgi:glycerol dehydrogenase